jgi:hypothetical protein
VGQYKRSEGDPMNQIKQATIYIGLNDSETGKQIHDTEKYISILKNVCRSYHVPFSMNQLQGGYFHEDGRYVEKNTLTLMMLDVPDETVHEIAKDLCAFFHQESVMIQSSPAEVCFIHEDI